VTGQRTSVASILRVGAGALLIAGIVQGIAG
jgi:hypothetical protein